MSQGHRRRNAGLPTGFRQPRITTPTAEPPRKLWPASNPNDFVAWWQQRAEKPLFVYFIQHEQTGPIKIGKANDPITRLAELQCGNPYPLALRAVVLAAADTERKLHSAWQGHRTHGEWFAFDFRGAHLLELAMRTQRAQVDAHRRGKDPSEIAAMPADRIHPALAVGAKVLIKAALS